MQVDKGALGKPEAPATPVAQQGLRKALRGIAVVVVRQTTRNETMVEKLHLVLLKLLAHIDLISPERMGKRHHVSNRAASMRLGERDLAGKREVFLRADSARFSISIYGQEPFSRTSFMVARPAAQSFKSSFPASMQTSNRQSKKL